MTKRRIHTTINEGAWKIIEKHLSEYGKLNLLIEEALSLLDRERERDISDIECLLIDIMDEANLVAFNAKTIEYVVSGEIEKALCENELEMVMRRLYRKPISEISLMEAVEGIKTCLLATRKASKVSVKKGEERVYLLVTSNLGENTDTLLCEALRRFFEKNYSVNARFEVFPQGYSIILEEKRKKEIKGHPTI
jgi:hypothetical protein